MASTNTSSLPNIHEDVSPPEAAIKPFVTQLSDARPATKTSVLLRVKRRRQRPASSAANTNPPLIDSATAATSSTTNRTEAPADEPDHIHNGEPVKKRKVSKTSAPEIIRLTLPLPSPKRRKSCEEKEQLDLIHRLSSAVSLYGDDTVVGQEATSTPTRRKEMEEENRIPPEGRAVSVHDSMGRETEPPRTKTPVKPKRSVIFRKLTDLRKVLHPATTAAARQEAHALDDWDSKGEEKSKWLRVVDVKLHDSDDDTKEEGAGPRLQRMRPRPASENGKDTAIDDGVDRSSKRRKLGLVVERSCTVLESDFWTRSGADIHAVACNKLEEEVARLLDSSLTTLYNQGGGSVAPFLSSLKIDARLGFVSGTARGRQMINHKLFGMDVESTGQTVLHFAAIWGDTLGVRAALEMGADPTIADSMGYTPSALARLHGHQDAVSTLTEAEARVDKSDKEDDFYYEVYCLEEENGSAAETQSELTGSAPSQVKVVTRNGNNNSPYASSFTTSESETNESPPGLIRMDGHRMSEDEDDSYALMELRNGFGYWNEQGELILEAGGEQQSSAASSIDYQVDDGRESCSEEDASIDYPDEQSCDDEDDEIREKNSHGFDFGNLGSDYDDYLDADAAHAYASDDSSDDGWKNDFRARFVPRNQQQGNIDSEDEMSSGGFGISSQRRMHGWNYSGGMSDGESDDDYAGPMLG